MNWSDIIQSIIGFVVGGGLGTLVTNLIMAKYKRQAAALANDAQAIANKRTELEEWQKIADRETRRAEEVTAHYDDLMRRKDARLISRDKEIADLKAEIARKDDKIEALYDLHSKDREIIDALRSENTALAIFRCDKVDCGDRKPPFAYQIPALALTETLKQNG
jgi:hypothetical protein